jgi:Flp pilus assembly protein TadD
VAHQIAPTFVKAINNLGVAYARSGDLDGAVRVYQAGLGVEPQDVALLSNLARAYQDQGRLDEAAATLAKVDSANNSNPFFFVYQAEIALARGDHAGALRYMSEALRRDSEVPEVHLGLVKVYLATGDVDKARHHLERALKLDATNPEARRYVLMLGLMTAEDQASPP